MKQGQSIVINRFGEVIIPHGDDNDQFFTTFGQHLATSQIVEWQRISDTHVALIIERRGQIMVFPATVDTYGKFREYCETCRRQSWQNSNKTV